MGEHGGVVLNTASIGGMGFEANLGQRLKGRADPPDKTTRARAGAEGEGKRGRPGVVRTKLAEALWKDHENQLNSATALGRIGEPEDVGSAVAFLVSDASSWVTGETFVIDGGQRLGNARPFRQGTGVHE
jgi:NAD(P)-dependent dehydrogenase (short-subunit alcohol dehydrogenase family)